MEIMPRLLIVLLTFNISILKKELCELTNDPEKATYYRISYKHWKYLWKLEFVLLLCMVVLFYWR